MPYDPKTGKYIAEDEGVATRMTGLLRKDDPYMRQAATVGTQAANRRGLLNSSMAVGAAEGERIRAALPIASQEAGQAHASNLAGRNIQFQDIAQQRDITSREGMQETDIRSRERMQGRDIGFQTEAQKRELDSRATLQRGELASRERISGLDRSAQERIAGMNVAAAERNSASQLAATFEQSYASMFESIMANTALNAVTRQQYLTHVGKMRDSNLALVEQMYGIDLQWATPGSGNPPQTTPGPQPNPGNNSQIHLQPRTGNNYLGG